MKVRLILDVLNRTAAGTQFSTMSLVAAHGRCETLEDVFTNAKRSYFQDNACDMLNHIVSGTFANLKQFYVFF